MRTRQEIFTQACEGLATQGFQRSLYHGSCAYRGHDGLKCAIGHCITDEQAAGLRNTQAVNTWAPEVFERCDLNPADATFYLNLQRAHDGACDPVDMKSCLRALAVSEGLPAPECIQ